MVYVGGMERPEPIPATHDRWRTATIRVRAADHRRMSRAAERAGLRLSTFLRALVLRALDTPSPE